MSQMAAVLTASDTALNDEPAPNSDPIETLRVFEAAIYGRVPALPLSILEKRQMSPSRVVAPAQVERWSMEAPLRDGAQHFDILVVLPTARPRAILLVQVFQRSPDGLAYLAQALSLGARFTFSDAYVSLLLGKYIHAPPFESVLARGFAVVFFCPGDVVPDKRDRALAVLARIDVGGDASPGALAAWAGLSSSVRRALCGDERFDGVPIAAYGHSRHGKAALLAAAFDTEFSAVIAHQSGRFGASLTEGGGGETPAQIARAFPHWFCGAFHELIARNAPPPIDQDQLLALIAPRPILLGSAMLDFWSDPRGTLRAARRASRAFENHGRIGFAPRADYGGGISHFSRWGGHGVNAVDWRHFLGFMEAKFALGVEEASSS